MGGDTNTMPSLWRAGEMMDANDKPLYGIWLPGEGWLKGKDVFADANIDKARQVARRVGRGAVVLYIDPAIVDMERLYLENEKRSLWHTFKNYFGRKSNTPASSR